MAAKAALFPLFSRLGVRTCPSTVDPRY